MNEQITTHDEVNVHLQRLRTRAEALRDFSMLSQLSQAVAHLPGTPLTAAALHRAVAAWQNQLAGTAADVDDYTANAQDFLRAVAAEDRQLGSTLDSSLSDGADRRAP